MPATWKQYGVDANGDEKKDPYNPVDAIFAAARYLKAAGAEQDLRRAIFAYNHADWYVDSVLMRARLIGGLPTNLVGSLTGLTQGISPCTPRARYADDLSEREATKRVARAATPRCRSRAASARRGINVFAKPGSPGHRRPGRQDREDRAAPSASAASSSSATSTATPTRTRTWRSSPTATRCPRRKSVSRDAGPQELKLPKKDPKPTRAASAGTQARDAPSRRRRRRATSPRSPTGCRRSRKERLFADPQRARRLQGRRRGPAPRRAASCRASTTFKRYFVKDFGLKREDVELKQPQGRLEGHRRHDPRPHRQDVRDASRRTCSSRSGPPAAAPRASTRSRSSTAGSCSSRPRSTAPRARTRSSARDAKTPTIGQILLMSKEELQRPRAEQPAHRDLRLRPARHPRLGGSTGACSPRSSSSPPAACGRRSRRCTAATVYTASGNVSHHSSGSAVDIAKINGIPILGHQGKGSITDIAVRRLLTLQGTMKPAQIITLMKYDGADNTLAMGDHHDHIHVGFQPHVRRRTASAAASSTRCSSRVSGSSSSTASARSTTRRCGPSRRSTRSTCPSAAATRTRASSSAAYAPRRARRPLPASSSSSSPGRSGRRPAATSSATTPARPTARARPRVARRAASGG